MMHPYIIDTSVIYNTSGERRKKTKLARLAAEFLSESIQTGKDGHDSIEDSWSALRLVQLKLQKSKYILILQSTYVCKYILQSNTMHIIILLYYCTGMCIPVSYTHLFVVSQCLKREPK